jgi:transmembrane sensor
VTKQELYALIDKYLAGQVSEEEFDLLSRYYNSFQENSNWEKTELGSRSETEAKIFAGILKKINSSTDPEIIPGVKGKVSNPDFKRRFFTLKRIGFAACVIGLLVLVFLPGLRNNSGREVAQTSINKNNPQNDVLPGRDKAILKLSDGSTIELDSAKNGALANQGNTTIIKLNGKLNYSSSAAPVKVLYNTISTPRGGKYQIELSDGSQVWLNAASSLRFPTAFKGKERKIEITGEAYLEVAKNTAMPFIVSINGAEIQVLGTQFNVMAYTDEPSLKTTLVEGSVKFVSNGLTNILKPRQQSQLLKNGQVKLVNDIDVEEVLAWKNGFFHFQAVDIGTVMRQLSRWYDVEVVYNKHTDDLFYAEIPRNTKLSDVLKALELTGKIHFEIETGRIIVKP